MSVKEEFDCCDTYIVIKGSVIMACACGAGQKGVMEETLKSCRVD